MKGGQAIFIRKKNKKTHKVKERDHEEGRRQEERKVLRLQRVINLGREGICKE